jgi:hypothetical protein
VTRARANAGRPWTDADIDRVADLDHPPSQEVIDRVMPIVLAVLGRPDASSKHPKND